MPGGRSLDYAGCAGRHNSHHCPQRTSLEGDRYGQQTLWLGLAGAPGSGRRDSCRVAGQRLWVEFVDHGALAQLGCGAAAGPRGHRNSGPRGGGTKSIASTGSVTIASDATYPPMESIAPGTTTIIGMDPDLGHAIGTVLGIKFGFQNVTFNKILLGLKSGQYDLGMSSFTDEKSASKPSISSTISRPAPRS